MTDVLPSGWIRVPLGDVGRWTGGGTPSKAEPRYWTNGTMPWVSPKDMKQEVLHGAEDSITEAAVAGSATQVVPPGSVLIVTRSGILKHTLPVATNAVQVALNQDLKAITPHDGVDGTFIAWALRAFENRVLHECSKAGTTVQSIETSKLQAFGLPIAPLAEQRRIVAALEEHLSDLQSAVDSLERAKRNITRYADAVLVQAVRCSLCDSASPDSAVVGAGAFSLPPGWYWAKLGDFLPVIEAGASFKCEERPPREGETGIAKVSAVSWGTYDEDESKTVLDESRINAGLLIEAGDFLFSRANTVQLVGACVIAQKVTRRVMLSDKILRFRFRGLDPRWALVCLRSKWGRSEIERLATGNQESMRNIGQERIRAIRIPVPPSNEQRRIVGEVERCLDAGRRSAADIDIQLARAARLRQSILKHAFEGKLVTQDPDDEPVSPLLAMRPSTSSDATVASPRSRAGRARTTARRGTD